MGEKKVRKGLPLWAFGLIAIVLALVAVMIFVPVDNTYGRGEHWGWAAGTWWFWKSFLFEVRSQFRGDALAQGILYFTVAAAIFMTVIVLMRKEPKKLLNVAILLLAGFVTSYIAVVLFVGIDTGYAGRKAMVGLTGGLTLGLIALLLLFFDALNSGLLPIGKKEEAEPEKAEVAPADEEEIRRIVRDEMAKNEPEEEPKEEEKGLGEEEVREIVRDELGKQDKAPQNITVVVNNAEAKKEEEPVAEEEPEE